MTIFADKAAAANAFRADFASMLSGYMDASALANDSLIYAKLMAAEADAGRHLRVFLEPTVVVPDSASEDELETLEAEGVKYAQEAAYDYSPDMFQGDRWGMIVSRHRPIISIQSMRFVYPSPAVGTFEVPKDWLRLERKYGHIQLVPTVTAWSVPLSAVMLQSMGAGRTLPHMIEVRYTAGLRDVETNYPDLIDVIGKMAAFRFLQGQFLPQSGSISADGLSQSQSVDLQKWDDAIQEKLNTLRDAIHGVRVMVL